MRPKILLSLIAIPLLALTCFAQDTTQYWYWYTTPEISRPIAVDSDSSMKFPHALQLSDGRVLVVYLRSALGYQYAILDRYGKIIQAQNVNPANAQINLVSTKLIADGQGGALFCWPEPANPGIRAQRINSEGAICWGDSGREIYPIYEGDYDICIDGNGGFYLAAAPDEPEDEFSDLYLQHIDSLGQTTWGDSGVVVSVDPSGQRYPKVTHDGEGGCYVVWEDWRPPFTSNGAFFMQRFYPTGRAAWDPPNGQFLCYHGDFHQLLPDGENGFIIHTNPGGPYYNSVWRIDSTGAILWSRDHVSWYLWAEMLPGEPGFFYLGFPYGSPAVGGYGVFGQRMDIEGHIYWPTWGSGQVGAEFGVTRDLANGGQAYGYHDGRFFAFYELLHLDATFLRPKFLYTQALDTDGEKTMGDSSVFVAIVYEESYSEVEDPHIIPDGEGGAVCVWCEETCLPDNTFDIYGKHVNADGTLGGPDPRKRPVEIYPRISGISEGRIHFEIPASGRVQVDLYNLLGQHIGTIKNAYLQSGKHSVSIDPTGLVSGIYFVKLSTLSGCHVAKMPIIR